MEKGAFDGKKGDICLKLLSVFQAFYGALTSISSLDPLNNSVRQAFLFQRQLNSESESFAQGHKTERLGLQSGTVALEGPVLNYCLCYYVHRMQKADISNVIQHLVVDTIMHTPGTGLDAT